MSLAKKISLFRWSAYYEGVFFTIFRVILKSTQIIGARGTRSEWFRKLAEEQFDKRFNVKTEGLVTPEEMHIPVDRIDHAVEYSPTSANQFSWILSKLPVDLSDYVFVDLGSGKGRALLMASEFPFKQVLGVELSQELHQDAMLNIGSFSSRNAQCDEVVSFNQDATEFKFPDSPLVLFFANPFSAKILQEVLDHLQSTLNGKRGKVIVLYYNPIHASVFHNSPMFSKPNFNFHASAGWELYTT